MKVMIYLGIGPGDIAVDALSIVAVEAVAKVDRAGQPMLARPHGNYDKSTYDGSVIRLSNGGEIRVPQSVEEVVNLMATTVNKLD